MGGTSARGETLGENFVEPFIAKFAKMLADGVADKERRVMSAQVSEQLNSSHPNRYDLPNTHRIGNDVIRFLNVHRTAGAIASGKAPATKSNRYTIPVLYTDMLEHIAEDDSNK